MTLKVRGFELVSKGQYESTDATLAYDKLELPRRATQYAAGYDIKSTKEFTLNPGEEIVIPTGFKAYMQPSEMLCLYPRSGMGFKYKICLANTVGIGDGDYYNCESNEGHYFIKLVNRGNKVWEVKEGDGIGQAIFQPILLADGDDFLTGETRTGGFGSTDEAALILNHKLDFDGDTLNVSKINDVQRILSSKARDIGYSYITSNSIENLQGNVEPPKKEDLIKTFNLLKVDNANRLAKGDFIFVFSKNSGNYVESGNLINVDDTSLIVSTDISLDQLSSKLFEINEYDFYIVNK